MSDRNVFLSYDPKDDGLVQELKRHLHPWQREDFIHAIYDTIDPGLNWQQARAAQLNTSSLILLLISPDFLASDYIHNVEIPHALQRYEAGEARVIPILLRPTDWENTPFGTLKSLPTNALPITAWSNQDEAFLHIIREIRAIINELHPPSITARKDTTLAVSENDQVSWGARGVLPQHDRPLGTTLLVNDIHAKWVSAVSWSPDSTRIASASGDGTVRVWDSTTKHNFLTYHGHSHPLMANVHDVKWSPDGERLASCGPGFKVRVWDAHTGKDLVLYTHQKIVNTLSDTFAVAWSPDSTRIVSATGGVKDIDQSVHVWNAATGRTHLKYYGHASGIVAPFSVPALAWSPNGHYIASAGTDKKVKRQKLDPLKLFYTAQVWNPKTGQTIATSKGSSSFIYEVAWSPDSRYIATAETEGLVRIWDAQSGEHIRTYEGHTKEVRTLAWSPDGTCIASAGNDHTVQLWASTTGELLYVYREHTHNVSTLAWSPDGTRIASGDNDNTVRIWWAA